MMLKTAVKALRGTRKRPEFAREIGVRSATTVFYWEKGRGIDAFNRAKLLEYARRIEAAPDVIAALEKAQADGLPESTPLHGEEDAGT